MELLPADYALCGFALTMAILGLFRGLSGTLAFMIAVVAAVLAGIFGWDYSSTLTAVPWMRVAGTLVAVLLVFGIVRVIVKRLVNGLLAQPSDAIFGFLTGAVFWVLIVVAWGYSGIHVEYSNLAGEAAKYVR